MMTTDPEPQSGPELSIILVSYNSRTDLQRCLPAIYAQKPAFSYEILVVDNHGSDGVADWLTGAFPDIRYWHNPPNSGYAGGNNLGLAHARGHWVLLLNPDTELRPGCLNQLITTARQFPNALITPKLLNPDGTINACGNQMHYTGITTCRGLNQPASFLTGLHSVPLLSGAALLASASVLKALGGFDEAYFMYFEDTDLSLRARLMNHPLLCEARAEITHHYRLGMQANKFYYLERNRLLTILKIFSAETRLRLLPALLLTEALTWAYSLRGWSFFRARFRTYAWLWQHRQEWREMHRAIQQERLVHDSNLLTDSLVSLPFEQLAGSTLGPLLNRLTDSLFRWLKPRWVSSVAPSEKTISYVER